MRALLILILPLFLVAEVHYAKVEPFKVYTIRSVVSGKVILSRDDLEGEIVNGEIIAIDDKVDKKDLVITKENISILKKQIEINQQLLPALKENLSRKRAYFNRVDSSSSFSKNQKDMAFASFLAAKRDFLSIKEKILTLKSQLNSLRDKETLLKDKISNKHITIKNRYLYKIYVKKGEFVLTNSLLAKVMDISK
ncbi:MAG: hypothetical protein GXO02_05470, partial [Epsilonproteobacteria bacterium]|nr:hypothetical protein [Campylobacterota bacterium]